MSHIAYERGAYDKSSKTLHKQTPTAPKIRGPDAWDIDPQQQIIDLLTEQCGLIHESNRLLAILVDRDPPYHSGSRTVEVDKRGLLGALQGTDPPPPES